MVEHMSAQTTTQTSQCAQSFNGSRSKRPGQPHHPQQQQQANELQPVRQHQPPGAGRPGSGSRFSLFRWFRRQDSNASADSNSSSASHPHQQPKRRYLFRRVRRRASTSSSSSGDTVYSTATVRSFAFHSGARHQQPSGLEDALLRLGRSSGAVGPFAPGAAKLRGSTATSTLPSAFSQRQDIETRYSLLPSSFVSYDSIPGGQPRGFAEVRLAVALAPDPSPRRAHVRGKRRAPEPPAPGPRAAEAGAASSAGRGRRKRRPAPAPPGTRSGTLSSNQGSLSSEASAAGMDSGLLGPSIGHDTLVLRRGVLLPGPRSPTPAGGQQAAASVELSGARLSLVMPRPWYKRNGLGEHSPSRSPRDSGARRANGDVLRGLPSPQPAEPGPAFPFEREGGSLSRLGFFQRDADKKRQQQQQDGKRKSGVSILMNISELDKEAAAIVQEEQARNRASMILQAAKMDEDFERRMGVNEEIVQEIVNSSMESSPRRSARALISRFNALGHLTRAGVNGSFFRSGHSSPKPRPKRLSQDCNGLDASLDRSLQPQQRQKSPPASGPRRESAAIFTEVISSGVAKGLAADESRPARSARSAAAAMTPAATKPSPQSNGEKESNNSELVRSLAAELDDVASGIARLRRELDKRPKMIETIDAEGDKGRKQTDAAAKDASRTNERKDKELDKEFTRIFDEIDRQLKAKESRAAAPKASSGSKSITNQVAKVIDILVSVEKEAAAAKGQQQPAIDRRPDSEARPSVVRLSGVDDRATAELKEMLKEMKHSLPKAPRPRASPERKPEADVKLSEPTDLSTTARPVFAPKASATKVSSGVQTSGNVRRVEAAGAASPRAKGADGAAREPKPGDELNRHLRGEYVELDATPRRAGTTTTQPENTYVNVMEKSLYANAQVAPQPGGNAAGGKVIERETRPRVKIDLRGVDNKEAATAGPLGGSARKSDIDEGEKLEEIKKQYMNTLAVNRLLRKLEAAIASGQHQQAANLAKELAQLKIRCSVVRQRPCSAKEKLRLNLYIEDKQAHQGPIPLQLPVNMTVAQLKAKIHIEFEIPANVQRWIIGKNLADNDESTLEELQAVEGSPVFLYLVAPPDLQDREAIKADKQPQPQLQQRPRDGVAAVVAEPAEEKGEEKAAVVMVVVREARERVINEKNDEQIREIKAEIELAPVELEPEPKPTVAEEAEAEEPQARETEDELAREEKLKRYEELMSLENCDVISNTEPIECPVCFMIFAPGEGVILRDCLHSFCRICVANVVRYCEEAEVKCPYRDADYTCESTLQEREIKALVPAEVYQQHLAKSIAQAENSAGNNAFHCKTPDCPGWCIYDDNVNNFLCPVCKVNNCLTCQAIHMGKNCRQYQEELKNSKESDVESKRTAAMLEEMVERGEALPCPTCAVVLMKKWGCDWLRCSMCKTEICWVTRGPRWGPAGKGDTSGGCRCGENGVKCHPRCNYCH